MAPAPAPAPVPALEPSQGQKHAGPTRPRAGATLSRHRGPTHGPAWAHPRAQLGPKRVPGARHGPPMPCLHTAMPPPAALEMIWRDGAAPPGRKRTLPSRKLRIQPCFESALAACPDVVRRYTPGVRCRHSGGDSAELPTRMSALSKLKKPSPAHGI